MRKENLNKQKQTYHIWVTFWNHRLLLINLLVKISFQVHIWPKWQINPPTIKNITIKWSSEHPRRSIRLETYNNSYLQNLNSHNIPKQKARKQEETFKPLMQKGGPIAHRQWVKFKSAPLNMTIAKGLSKSTLKRQSKKDLWMDQ